MPNTYLDNAQRWLDLTDVDYLGQFVKTWLAFNAWYRGAYAHSRDREVIDDFKWQPNVVRNKLVPLLGAGTDEAAAFRGEIGLLHNRLENYHLYSGSEADSPRITLTSVFLTLNPMAQNTASRSGMTYLVKRGGAGVPGSQVESVVTNRSGTKVFGLVQAGWDPTGLESDPHFVTGLKATQQGALKAVYRSVAPKVLADLTNNGGSGTFACGAHQFACSAEELFAGVCEVIYLMRNSLFHGELVPSREAAASYEPAYYIVRRLLRNLS